jgi:hypothetical protein
MLAFQAIVEGVAILVGQRNAIRLRVYQQNGIIFVNGAGLVFTKKPTHKSFLSFDAPQANAWFALSLT